MFLTIGKEFVQYFTNYRKLWVPKKKWLKKSRHKTYLAWFFLKIVYSFVRFLMVLRREKNVYAFFVCYFAIKLSFGYFQIIALKEKKSAKQKCILIFAYYIMYNDGMQSCYSLRIFKNIMQKENTIFGRHKMHQQEEEARTF